MLNFNRLVPNRVYRVRDKFTMPYDMKTPMKGTLVTVLSTSLDGTAEFFNNPYLQFRRYARYYIERKLSEKFEGQQVREINKQREVYSQHFGRLHPDVQLKPKPDMVRDYNVIYEIGQFNDLLNTNERIDRKSALRQSEIKFDQVVKKIKDIGRDFPNHKKYIYIPLDQYIDNPAMSSLWFKRDLLYNFGVVVVRKIHDDPSTIRKVFKNWTFIFMNHNELFYMNANDMNEETPVLMNKLFKRLRSSKGNIDLSVVDDENLTDNETENDQTLDQKNSDTITNYNKNVITTVNRLPIDDVAKDRIVNTVNSEVSKAKANTKMTPPQPTAKATEKPASDDMASSQKTADKKKTLSTTRITKPKEVEVDENKVEVDTTPQPTIKDIDISDLEEKVNKTVKEELKKTIAPTQSAPRLARIEKIKEEMKDLKVGEKSVQDLAKEAKAKQIDDFEVKTSVINPRMKHIKFSNFEKGYNEKLLEYDMMNILTSFAEKDRPLYLISINKEDISTAIDKIFRYSCVYEDEYGRRHSFSFDVPKFMNDKFMFLNGSDKIFINQIIPLPVTKVAPDQVQISSLYNKIFMTRFGKNVSNKVSKFMKLLGSLENSSIEFEKGNNLMDNVPYMTSMEYDELSKKFTTITLKNADTVIYLRQDDIRSICESEDLTYDKKDELPFAIETDKTGKKSLVCLDVKSGEVIYDGEDSNMTPIDFIIKHSDDEKIRSQFKSISGTKKSIYTRAKIMAKDVPVVLLLSFLIGLEPLLVKLKCNHKFSETRTKEDSTKRGTIQFADGFLSYDLYPYSNSLLLNGFYDIPTEDYNFLDFCSKDIYYDIFMKMFGRRNIGTAFENFQQLFVDSITKEVLEDYNLPTDFIDLVIYANTLLENNTFDKDGDLKNYRIRSNEMLNAHLYKVLSKAYESYRSTADNKNPNKFSIKTNELINNMFDSQVMEEYSNLNPIFEIDRMRATSYKGPGGCNVDKGFKIDKRAYNDSMLGILAQSSPVSANVGISRIMALNPNVTSLRGYLDVGYGEDQEKLDQTNLLSGAEMLIPMTATHDDPQRVGMASTQSRHTLAVMDSDVPLFGYGADKVLPKIISDKFAFKAKENGYVHEFNPDLGYMIVRYESGKSEVIDLTDRQSLNTGSGFYINNRLDPIYKTVGQKFSEGDVLAANSQFFEYDELAGEVIYKSGPLARVALIHGSFVYEDSTLVTEKFAQRMASYVDEVKEVRLGKNSNIYAIKSVGDSVNVNDPFIVFDESYEDDYLNQMLSKMNQEEKDKLIEASKNHVKSKWNGKVVDIKIYYTCPKSELSPSLRKVITNYERKIKERLKNFEEAGINLKDMTTLNDTADVTVPVNGKIAGTKMDEFQVLIKFFVQTVDSFSVGDKLSFSTALKGINQSTIPLGLEPYLVSDPSIKIDAFLSISGLMARMTQSASISLALNAVMIGAEKKIKDILEDKDT